MGALSHIRVLDLSRILAGPWATQMLGDLGADIIKVERPEIGDDTRGWGPPFMEHQPANAATNWRSAYFCCANRNKRSLAIDIQTAQGTALLQQLAAQSDVIVENFKTGGLAKYQLDYPSLAQDNPGLIYCSITGFGQDGPLAGRAGYDFMIQGMAGLMSITGEPDGVPMKVGVALSDVLTGVYACAAILAALIHRDRTGEGQYIDMSLFDVTMACLANQGFNYLASDKNPPRLGNAHPNIVPYQAFAVSDGYVILAIGNNQQFTRFCQLAGQPQWADDPRFSENRARVENRGTLVPLVAEAMRQQTSQWWLEKLAAHGIPAGPIHTIAQAFSTPQAQSRQLRCDITDANGWKTPTIASPLRLSETPPQYRHVPPHLGQHSKEILREILKLDTDAIAKLAAQKIIQCGTENHSMKGLET